MLRYTVGLVALLGLSTTAYADQCPTLMKQVDDAIAAPAEGVDVADATAHRNAGEAAHSAGDHAKSVEEFNKALAALKAEG